jgi:hypothetical protein
MYCLNLARLMSSAFSVKTLTPHELRVVSKKSMQLQQPQVMSDKVLATNRNATSSMEHNRL